MMAAAIKVPIHAWKATSAKLIVFFHRGQLYGSAGSMLGIGSRSIVPWRSRRKA